MVDPPFRGPDEHVRPGAGAPGVAFFLLAGGARNRRPLVVKEMWFCGACNRQCVACTAVG